MQGLPTWQCMAVPVSHHLGCSEKAGAVQLWRTSSLKGWRHEGSRAFPRQPGVPGSWLLVPESESWRAAWVSLPERILPMPALALPWAALQGWLLCRGHRVCVASTVISATSSPPKGKRSLTQALPWQMCGPELPSLPYPSLALGMAGPAPQQGDVPGTGLDTCHPEHPVADMPLSS